MSYDIIGDIHGHALTLDALLEKLDYQRVDGIYRHSSRRVIFVGDFIDGGPYQKQTLDIVRPMVENGAALAVMGNHEFNAVAYATPRDSHEHLRPRTSDNQTQHAAFLAEYPVDSPEYQATIAWFKTLPLWLDVGDLRVVHACWDRGLIRRISQTFDGSRLTAGLLHRANPSRSLRNSHWEFQAVETLLKGKEIPLPDGSHFLDRYGKKRHHIRIKWWDRQGTTYREKFLGAPDFETHIPDDEISGDHGIDYGHHEPPVFLGHYWLQGAPAPLENNVACLDYSVARSGGKLVAYRWSGEKTLRSDAFVWVERMESEPQSTTG